MKKVILGVILSSLSLFANPNIQVFTANSMHLDLGKGSKVQKVFFGTEEAFIKDSEAISKATGTVLSTMLGTSHANGAGLTGAAAGSLFVFAAAGAIEAYNHIVADHNYILLSVAIDSEGNETMLKTLIISNSSMNLKKAETLAMNDQLKFIEN